MTKRVVAVVIAFGVFPSSALGNYGRYSYVSIDCGGEPSTAPVYFNTFPGWAEERSNIASSRSGSNGDPDPYVATSCPARFSADSGGSSNVNDDEVGRGGTNGDDGDVSPYVPNGMRLRNHLCDRTTHITEVCSDPDDRQGAYEYYALRPPVPGTRIKQLGVSGSGRAEIRPSMGRRYEWTPHVVGTGWDAPLCIAAIPESDHDTTPCDSHNGWGETTSRGDLFMHYFNVRHTWDGAGASDAGLEMRCEPIGGVNGTCASGPGAGMSYGTRVSAWQVNVEFTDDTDPTLQITGGSLAEVADHGDGVKRWLDGRPAIITFKHADNVGIEYVALRVFRPDGSVAAFQAKDYLNAGLCGPFYYAGDTANPQNASVDLQFRANHRPCSALNDTATSDGQSFDIGPLCSLGEGPGWSASVAVADVSGRSVAWYTGEFGIDCTAPAPESCGGKAFGIIDDTAAGHDWIRGQEVLTAAACDPVSGIASVVVQSRINEGRWTDLPDCPDPPASAQPSAAAVQQCMFSTAGRADGDVVHYRVRAADRAGNARSQEHAFIHTVDSRADQVSRIDIGDPELSVPHGWTNSPSIHAAWALPSGRGAPLRSVHFEAASACGIDQVNPPTVPAADGDTAGAAASTDGVVLTHDPRRSCTQGLHRVSVWLTEVTWVVSAARGSDGVWIGRGSLVEGPRVTRVYGFDSIAPVATSASVTPSEPTTVNSFAFGWTNAHFDDVASSPLASASYRISDSDPPVVVRTCLGSEERCTLDGLALAGPAPASGDYPVDLWLRDEAGNEDETTKVRGIFHYISPDVPGVDRAPVRRGPSAVPRHGACRSAFSR